MCGITGFWRQSAESLDVLSQWGAAVNGALRHRGPDDAGLWTDHAAGIVLASRRLAILDLSPAGHQPMISHCGRYVIDYNGEVYNFLEIRRDLEREGQHFAGSSDTEVLVEACAAWGVERALSRLNGMFGFALWDTRDHTLTLVRHRLGVKPLYYGSSHNTFLFGSELKAFHSFPHFTGTLDRSSFALFLRLGYIPAPYSIYEGISKLPPGHLLRVSAPCERVSPRPYWSARTVVERGIQDPFRGDMHEAVERTELLLRDSVRLRMLADVPVGAFLSGGIDSSLVVALMKEQSRAPVRTFTVRFDDHEFNEADHAAAVARYLDTEHHERTCDNRQLLAVVDGLPDMFDEPFADSSAIPTYIVSKAAREHVTVA